MTKRLILVFGLLLASFLVVVATCLVSPRRAAVQLSPSTSCELRTGGLYHRFTDQQIPLVCRRDGHEIGRVEFAFGLEWFRTAIFPGRDDHSLICLSQDDQTIALFVIDLEQSSGSDRSVPKDFFIPNSSIIQSTSLGFRRCTNEDIA